MSIRKRLKTAGIVLLTFLPCLAIGGSFFVRAERKNSPPPESINMGSMGAMGPIPNAEHTTGESTASPPVISVDDLKLTTAQAPVTSLRLLVALDRFSIAVDAAAFAPAPLDILHSQCGIERRKRTSPTLLVEMEDITSRGLLTPTHMRCELPSVKLHENQTPANRSSLKTTDANYGYLRIIVDSQQSRIEYHPQSDGSAAKTSDDFVTVDLETRKPKHYRPLAQTTTDVPQAKTSGHKIHDPRA